MKISSMLLVALLACPAMAAATQPAATQPVMPTRVMIVSIDGLRPDVALRANMPHLRALMARGSFSFWARTTAVSITLPSHTSMLTGVPPEKHKVTWNNANDPHPQQPYPAVPTLFELAHQHGYTTAAVAGKVKFTVFDKPGTLDWKFLKEAGDDEVASMAVAFVREHQPQVLFVHFPDCDRVGHAEGWGCDHQVQTVEHADELLGHVLSALQEERVIDQTLIIVTADHGGQGRTHGPNDPRSRHIPWIAAGPGVKHNYDLNLDERLVINTEDTFATSCEVLGIPLPSDVDGKPVLDIFANRELLNPIP